VKIYDVCVVGVGGVVGSAMIRDLSQRGLAVIGVEKHDGPARETSGLNSRVIHSGFHETPGTLKARLALQGSRMLMEYAAAKGVALLQTGMLIAVPKHAMQMGLWRELRPLWHLWRGGRSHHVAFKWILSARGVRKIVPIEAIGGIFIPSVCVVDVMQLITSLQRDALEHGADIRYGQAVQDIARDGIDRYVITTSKGTYAARSIVNSAGLSAPFISRMAGGPDYTIERIRGEYYEMRGGMDRWKIRTLVYPATPAKSRSKGIHFGPRTDGRLFIGPDAADPDSPPTPKSVFLQAARKFLPSITDSDLEHSCTGVRPKYVRPDGISDFLIRVEKNTPPLANLIGIDSPGLSASMAIAEHTGTMLVKRASSVPCS
jgi:glycerol-3-phosphate dehydrogenase